MPRKRARTPRLCLLGSVLALGCVLDNRGDTQGATTSTSSTTSATSGNQSGAATSAPGSASATNQTTSDHGPTMASTASTTSTTTESITNPWTGWNDESCSFLACEDVSNVENECDNWAQDCPEGQKCVPYIAGGGSAWDALKCVDVTGDDQPGEACTSEGAASGVDSCIEGAMCWGVDIEGVGTCVGLCTGTPDAPVCEHEGSCTISAESIIILCIPPCDPLLQDCPHPSDACYPINEGFTCAPDASGEEGQANDPCEFINVCDEGLMCAEAALVGVGCEPGSTGCCTPFCAFPGGACPNPDQQCVQYFEPAMLPPNDPWLDIGVCGLPG